MQSAPTTLTPAETDQFQSDGFVVVRNAFAREDADAMQDSWWQELEELYRIRRDDRSTWFQPVRDLRRGKNSPLQRKIHTPRVHGAIDDLLGPGLWQWPKHWGRAVVTFPQGGTWDVPGHRDRVGAAVWHWDSPVEWHADGMSALFAFTFIGAVAAGGGGTSILAGSHRLLSHWHSEMSQKNRDAAARRNWFQNADAWLKALSGVTASPVDRRSAFMVEGAEIAGIRLRVVELSGEPGDMVFCHPTIVHCVSPNCGAWPRMMRIGTVPTNRFVKRRSGSPET